MGCPQQGEPGPCKKKKRGRLERRPTELEEFETLAHGEKYLLAGIPRLRAWFSSSLEAAFRSRFKFLSPLFEVIRQILLQSVRISQVSDQLHVDVA